MFVILCEDSEMGKDFWGKINRFCLDGKAKLVTASGVDNMHSKVKTIPLTSEDNVLFAIDNIGDEKVRGILSALETDATERGYKYQITQYYCIEEVFLSFCYFADWMKLSNDVRDDIWKPIYDFLIGVSSFDYSKDQKFRDRFPNDTTREHLANSYLNCLTTDKGGGLANSKGFWIHKGVYGKCWYTDCVNGKGVPYYCNQQYYTCYRNNDQRRL